MLGCSTSAGPSAARWLAATVAVGGSVTQQVAVIDSLLVSYFPVPSNAAGILVLLMSLSVETSLDYASVSVAVSADGPINTRM